MSWLYLLPILIVCALAVYIALHRRRADPNAMSPVVRGLLEQAVEQGSYMSVNFESQVTGDARFLGPCPQFDSATMLLDIGMSKGHPEWTGEMVLVSFRLDTKKLSSYYQFTSRIQGMRHRRDRYCLVLETPQEILSSQKRKFVRIHPPREALLGLGIWPLDDDAARPNQSSDLSTALFRYRQGQDSVLSLMDISAAGLRLGIVKDKQSMEPAPDFQVGTRLICLLMLQPDKGEEPLQFWFDCTVAHHEEPKTRAVTLLGLSFSAWAIAHPGKIFLEWSLAGENGWVGPLGTWVWHQQLAQVARSAD